ncbi:hypothetical protein MNBD_PLANCTO02-3411 [hydrothermal vent metagenome]|uniref:Helix-hairpin-helix DNA-binding motif class 1 domain-containing protein n=1 Tax=hydrothermal vent metagenome TaxID=652676 RepID=A0A3B1DI00_9ZZZZ
MVDETQQPDFASLAERERLPLSTEQPDSPSENPTEEKETHPFLWLKKSDQLVLGVVLILCVGMSLIYWVRLSAWGKEVVEIDRQQSQTLNYQLDLNSATWVELALLDGIGETLALRIIEDRKQQGPYHTIDDLQRVSGIGKKTIEKLRNSVRVE